MILFLCYVFPPLAVLLMGRPFSAVGNCFLIMFGWVPGVKHALVCYADYKIENGVKRVTKAIDNPAYTKKAPRQAARQPAPRQAAREVIVYDNPHVGKNGTFFRPKG